MARLYADENFPQPAVERLRELGHDVLTVQGAGKAQQKLPDEAVLADACADGRAVVTHNRQDFRHLHTTIPDHEGIIACSEDLALSASLTVSMRLSRHSQSFPGNSFAL